MIESVKAYISGFDSALDCGAGIGRVSKETLIKKFKNVDLLEPAATQLDQARKEIPSARSFFCEGMQEHNFETKYDCIWI